MQSNVTCFLSLCVDAVEMGVYMRLIENSFHHLSIQPSGSLPCTFSLAHSSLLSTVHSCPAHRATVLHPLALDGPVRLPAPATRLQTRARGKNNADLRHTSIARMTEETKERTTETSLTVAYLIEAQDPAFTGL